MRNILITGGAGNIGGSLAHRLVAGETDFVVVVDNLTTGALEKMPPAGRKNFRFVKADVNSFNDMASIMLSHRFQYVFHYAAVVGVARTLKAPLAVLRDIDGIRNVLDLAKNTGVQRVFYASSSEVYGEPVSLPQFEDTTPLNSRLPYAVVKNAGEAFLRSYYQEYGLAYTIFRFFNTYGPAQSDDFVLPRFIRAALNGDAIYIYGDGLQTRTFCYVDDNIETTLKLLNSGSGEGETLNIGNDAEITILDLAKKVILLTNSQSQIIHKPPLKEGDMSRRQPDISRMKHYLQRELTPLDEGIRRLIQSYQSSGY